MVDETEKGPPQAGGENRGVNEAVSGEDDSGERAANVAQPVPQDAEQGQTTTPGEASEADIPPDEEMNTPDE